MRTSGLVHCMLGLALGLLPGGGYGATPVDVELVLAVDVSPSMDPGEQELQRAGYVAALQHPEVLRAIRSGYHRRVAITYMEWGGTTRQGVVLPWTLIDDEASARSAAELLAAAPFRASRGTSISGALAFASSLFSDSGYEGERRIIDVSGDGPNNIGPPVVAVRDGVVARGFTINGLPIMLRRAGYGPWSIPNLDIYYSDCVIGGPGAFVLPVEDPRDFAETIRRKLVLEIADQPAHLLPAVQSDATPRIDCLIGEKLRRQWNEP